MTHIVEGVELLGQRGQVLGQLDIRVFLPVSLKTASSLVNGGNTLWPAPPRTAGHSWSVVQLQWTIFDEGSYDRASLVLVVSSMRGKIYLGTDY